METLLAYAVFGICLFRNDVFVVENRNQTFVIIPETIKCYINFRKNHKDYAENADNGLKLIDAPQAFGIHCVR